MTRFVQISRFLYAGYLHLLAPVQKVQAVGTAKKLAFHRACENAFSKVVITVLPSGKVGVQVGRQRVPCSSVCLDPLHNCLTDTTAAVFSPQVFRDSEANADNLLQDLLVGCPPMNTTPQELSERDHPTTCLPTNPH